MYSYVLTVLLCAGALGAILAVAGGVLAYRGFMLRSQGGRSQEWPSTSGVIEEADVRAVTAAGAEGRSTSEHVPYVRYRYTVNNQSYQASHLSPGLINTGRSPEQARALVDRFPVGSSVQVWYNPRDPNEAVIDQRSSGAAAGLTVGIILLVISAGVICLFFKLAFLGIIAAALQ